MISSLYNFELAVCDSTIAEIMSQPAKGPLACMIVKPAGQSGTAKKIRINSDSTLRFGFF